LFLLVLPRPAHLADWWMLLQLLLLLLLEP
jgi:hypothetical protein